MLKLLLRSIKHQECCCDCKYNYSGTKITRIVEAAAAATAAGAVIVFQVILTSGL